jgi:mannose-6-phosphate isomerase-like protein (cupin superfamily)
MTGSCFRHGDSGGHDTNRIGLIMPMQKSASLEPGFTIQNRFNGETFVFTEGDAGSDTCRFDVILAAGGSGGGNALEHVHPLADETFTVRHGALKVVIDGQEHIAGPGQSVTVPKGARHFFVNAHDGETRATVEFQPAQHFIRFFANFATTTEQRPNWYSRQGDPSPLLVAVTLNAYRDHFYVAKLPVGLQKRLFAFLAPLARLLGYRVLIGPTA